MLGHVGRFVNAYPSATMATPFTVPSVSFVTAARPRPRPSRGSGAVWRPPIVGVTRV